MHGYDSFSNALGIFPQVAPSLQEHSSLTVLSVCGLAFAGQFFGDAGANLLPGEVVHARTRISWMSRKTC